jgi:uncharacterized membrane protein
MTWVFAAASALTYPVSLAVDGASFPGTIDALHWTLQAVIAALFAWRARFGAGRAVAQFLAPLFLYIAIASVVAVEGEPLIGPALLTATVLLGRRLDDRLFPAIASCTATVTLWALSPLLTWATGAAASLVGSPMLVTDVPQVLDAVKQLLLPGLVVAGSAVLAARLRSPERAVGWAIAGVLLVVGAHSLYKQVFAISTYETFVRLGLSERTIWEAGLATVALVAARLERRGIALALAIAAAGHEALYTLLLHNPLWAPQAVGDWPVVNLLLPVYALALGLAVAAKRAVGPTTPAVERGLGILQMVLVVLFTFSELRQLFHGSLLTQPGLAVAEDILRSILSIALGIGFLLWGITRQERDWRIASLALMLAAVGKVFLFDASGLEGVTRIASFVALGLSLIGIGWLYSRHLGSDRLAAPA